MSGMDDVFGRFAVRPDHRDFWRLSEIVLRMDGAMEAATSDDEKQRVFERFASVHVDLDSLSYLALQRAIRALGIRTRMDLIANTVEVARLSALYIDGFTTGCEFTTRPTTLDAP